MSSDAKTIAAGGCVLGAFWLGAWAFVILFVWIIAHVIASAF